MWNPILEALRKRDLLSYREVFLMSFFRRAGGDFYLPTFVMTSLWDKVLAKAADARTVGELIGLLHDREGLVLRQVMDMINEVAFPPGSKSWER